MTRSRIGVYLFISSVKRKPVEQYRIMVPISGLELEGLEGFELREGIIIRRITSGEIEYIKENLLQLMKGKGHDKAEPLTSWPDKFRDRIIMEIRTEAEDRNKLVEAGIEIAERVLDVLRLFLFLGYGNNYRSSKRSNFLNIKIDIGDSRKQFLYTMIFDEEDRPATLYSEVRSEINNFTINEELVDRAKNYLSDLIEVIFSDTNSVIHKKVRKTVKWFSDGINDSRLSDAFVKYFIAIESLLIFSDKRKAYTLSSRGGIILSDVSGDQCKYGLELRGLYSTRGEIVHEGSLALKFEEFKKLEVFAFMIITNFSKLLSEGIIPASNSEVIKWFKKKGEDTLKDCIRRSWESYGG